VSSPSDHQPPPEPERRGPSTQEIPVVTPGATSAGATASGQHAPPLPPHPGAVSPAPVAMGEPQPTGPVGFVPGPPSPATPPVPPPAPDAEPAAPPAGGPVWPDTLESDLLGSGEQRAGKARADKGHSIGAPRDTTALLGLGLAVLALVLLELGLALRFGTESYWSAVPLWSAFATLCAALGVVAFALAYRSAGPARSAAAWRIAGAGLVGLAVFWVLVVLSVVASDRGFLLTAPLGALGAALWIGAGRKA
jgi:hypothetical protein